MSKTISEAITQASKIGRVHGISAAMWWEQDTLGGRVTGDARPTAKAVLKGLEDGDPEILDSLPYPDLSGQWADGYSSHDLLNDVGVNDGDASFFDGLTDDIFTAYELAFNEAVEDSVSKSARAVLAQQASELS